MNSGKIWVIGDIHGYSIALDRILRHIQVQPDDTVITLGDYIDRGPDSCGVINRLLELEHQCSLIPLLGNHEDHMMSLLPSIYYTPKELEQNASAYNKTVKIPESEIPPIPNYMIQKRKTTLAGNFLKKYLWFLGMSDGDPKDKRDARYRDWLRIGGVQTLQSYGLTIRDPENLPETHLNFIHSCRLYHETDTAIFMHAGYEPHLPMEQQNRMVLLCYRLKQNIPDAHISGKTAYVGHSSQHSGEILNAGHLLCLDTNLYGGKWLTAMEIQTRQIFQVDSAGMLRRP